LPCFVACRIIGNSGTQVILGRLHVCQASRWPVGAGRDGLRFAPQLFRGRRRQNVRLYQSEVLWVLWLHPVRSTQDHKVRIWYDDQVLTSISLGVEGVMAGDVRDPPHVAVTCSLAEEVACVMDLHGVCYVCRRDDLAASPTAASEV